MRKKWPSLRVMSFKIAEIWLREIGKILQTFIRQRAVLRKVCRIFRLTELYHIISVHQFAIFTSFKVFFLAVSMAEGARTKVLPSL